MSFPKGSLGAAAVYYAGLGWPVFPLVPGEKLPLLSKKRGGNGVLDATTDTETVTAWWTKYPDANIGLATGRDADLYVVDIDDALGEDALLRYGALPPTPESHTGKGRHLLFSYKGGRNTAGRLGPKIDTRGEGGYIVAPPSLHPNGGRYRWVTPPHKAPVAPLPQSIVDQLESVAGSIAPAEGARSSALEVVLNGVAEGGRNQALTEYVGRLFAMGHRELEVLKIARSVNATEFRPPLGNAEVEAVVNSVASAHLRNHGRGPAGTIVPVGPTPMVTVGVDVFDAMLHKAQQPVDALPTMWPTWNRACRMYGGGVGLARGWHVVAAGGAGVGKSLVALNMTAEALLGGHSVGWVSLEMSREQLLLRLLGIATGRKLRDMEPGAMFDPDAFTAASFELMDKMNMAGSRLVMAERPSRDVVEVDRLMGEAIDQGCRLIIVDYLQLVSVNEAPKMDDAMRRVSATVQSRAYRQNVNTLALSQLNRSTTADRDNAPTIYGLMGGSSLENDADQIILLDHTSKKQTPEGITLNAELAKNRHGEVATIPLLMNTSTLRLREPQAPAVGNDWYERGAA
jgi:KaiC/GvpD/RAD55 family RecA-like ATPase